MTKENGHHPPVGGQVDYHNGGAVVGIEVLDASKKMQKTGNLIYEVD